MANDFHKEMGSYLDKRRGEKKSIKDVFKRSSQPEFKEIDEVEQEIDELEAQEQDEMSEEYDDEPRKGFLSRLFGGVFGGGDEEFEDSELVESRPELDEDVRKVLKISFDWINQLPSDKKIKFKHSQDFVEYKAVLEKYGLLRKKEEVEYAQRS